MFKKVVLSLSVILLIPNPSANGADRDFALYTNIGLSSSVAPDRFNDFWGTGPSFGFESGSSSDLKSRWASFSNTIILTC